MKITLLLLIIGTTMCFGQKEISTTYIDKVFNDTVETTKEQMFRVQGTQYLLTMFLQKINSKYYINIVDVESQFNFQTANTSDKVAIKLVNGDLIKLVPSRVTTSKRINPKNFQLTFRCEISKSDLERIKENGVSIFYISIDYERWDFPIPEAYKFDFNEHIEAVIN